MKFLAVFDPVPREHLGFIKSYPHSTSYLSPGVQNEFIHLMASHVRKDFTEKIKKPSTMILYLTQPLTRRIASRLQKL